MTRLGEFAERPSTQIYDADLCDGCLRPFNDDRWCTHVGGDGGDGQWCSDCSGETGSYSRHIPHRVTSFQMVCGAILIASVLAIASVLV